MKFHRPSTRRCRSSRSRIPASCRGCNSAARISCPQRTDGKYLADFTMPSWRKTKNRLSVVRACDRHISDAELAAYRAYPETFFGEIRRPTRHAKTLVDLCDFFYETYKNTPR